MSASTATNDRPAKPFSLSFGSRSKPIATKVTPKKRNYATLTADDSDDDQEAPPGKAQLVHSFDQAAGGAVGLNKKEEKGPLVIAAQRNLDWREEARRRRGGANLLPAEEQARRAGANNTDDGNVEEEKPVYGLVVADKTQIDGDVQMEEVKVEVKPKSADEEALDALLGKKESTMIIEQAEQEDTRFQSRTSDTHAFRADIASRPDPASLADYEAVPIEDFGLALLRGQGYKPGDPIGRRKTAAPVVTRIPQKRANLLGIGAKEVPEGLEEMGAWGKGAKKGSKIDRSYNPLVLRNKQTGEVLTEAELQTRKEQQSLVLEDVQEKKSRRNRDYDDEKYKSSRHSSSRRDRSRSRDRRERRDRDREHRKRDKDDTRSRREKDYDDRDYDSQKDRRSYRDDHHDRRDGQDRDDHKSSRDKASSRHDRRKDDYEDRKYKERKRDDRR